MQAASFLSFTCIFFVFIHRVRTREPEAWTLHASKKWHQDWRTLAAAMTFSFLGIIVRTKIQSHSFILLLTAPQIRSVYRVAELSQGYVGFLATTESYFYGLGAYLFPLLKPLGTPDRLRAARLM